MKHPRLDIDQLLIFLLLAVTNLAPFLALVPTAWLVGVRTYEHLRWPWPIALVAALAVELLGVAVTVTALGNWTWNRGKHKTAAPVVLPVVLCAVYFVAAELLTVGLDIASGPVTVAKCSQAVFPVLGLAGMAVLAIRFDQAQRVAEADKSKDEARAKRAERAERKKERQLATSSGVSIRPPSFACKAPGCQFVSASQNGLNAHARAHGNGHERIEVAQEAQDAS